MKAYHHILQRYLGRLNQITERANPKNPTPPTEDRTTMVDDGSSSIANDKKQRFEQRVINSLPKTLQKNAQLLLDHVKEDTKLSWNDRGELVLDERSISGSNITDLLHETLRKRKLDNAPIGWNIFSKTLRESNIPMNLIGNKKRWSSTTRRVENSSLAAPVTKVKTTKTAEGLSSWLSYNHGKGKK